MGRFVTDPAPRRYANPKGLGAPLTLYGAFQPEEVRRLVERFEWHFTPKHGRQGGLAMTAMCIRTSRALEPRSGPARPLWPITLAGAWT